MIIGFCKILNSSKNVSNYRIPPDIQAIPFEINLKKEKWLFVSVYKRPSRNNQYFSDSLSELLNFYSGVYE